MANPFLEYLNLSGQDTNISSTTDPFSEYARLVEESQQSATPDYEGVEPLTPRDPVGFAGALGRGIVSGATLGYVETHMPDDMTTGELSGQVIGELAGGLVPLLGVSAVTGGFGAPVAGAARMKKAYDLLKKIKETSGVIAKSEKLKKAATVVKETKKRDKYIRSLGKIKEEYIGELIKTGVPKGRIKQALKTPVLGQSSGLIGKSEQYQKLIKTVANSKYGWQGANAVNKFVSTGAAFAGTGVLRKRGEGTFGELKMADRIKGIPGDIWMGGLFTAAGLPSMRGVKGGGVIEGVGLLGLGAYGDYLSGAPNPEMTLPERMVHGLGLLAFHGIQQGMTNIGIKDKMFKALIDMNIPRTEAYSLAYSTKEVNDILKKGRIEAKKEGVIYKHKTEKDKFISIVETTPAKEKEPAEILVKDLTTNTLIPYKGKTLAEAKNKIRRFYDRLDPTSEAMYNDIPQALKKNIDFKNKMKDELPGKEIPKETQEVVKRRDEIGKERAQINKKLKTASEKSSIKLKERLESLSAEESSLKANPLWRKFNAKKQALKKELSKSGYGDWDTVALIKAFHPSKKISGKNVSKALDNLTVSQIERMRKFNKSQPSSRLYELGLFPDNYISKSDSKFHNILNIAREKLLNPIFTFRFLGKRAGDILANKLEKFEMYRTGVMGDFAKFNSDLKIELDKYGIKMSEVMKYMHIMRDGKYEKQRQSKEYKEFEKKLEDIKVVEEGGKTVPETNLLSVVQNMQEGFFDSMAKILMSSNSWVFTTSKSGKIKSDRFNKIVNSKGKEIEIVDMNKNPELHFAQMDSFLEFVKNKGVTDVIPKNAKKRKDGTWTTVKADRKKSKSYYEPGYSPRVITDRFIELSGVLNKDKGLDRAIRDLMDKPEIKNLDIPETRKYEIARQQLNDIINMRGPQRVYGAQFRRIADLPTHYYLKKTGPDWMPDNVEIIQTKNIYKPDGSLYKKGDKITERGVSGKDKKVVIEEVVPVYETDYNLVLKKYSDNISHSTASHHAYGTKEAPGFYWKKLTEDLGLETKDRYYEEYASKAIKGQLYGEAATPTSKILRPITRASALVGLSFPTSGFKNIMLGQTMNWSVFTTRGMINTMGKLLSGGLYKSEADYARGSGYIYQGSHDLYLSKKPFSKVKWLQKIAENAGFMKTTEAFNRIFSSTLGKFELQNHIDNVAGVKNMYTKGVSQGTSKQILIDVFGFNGNQVKDMVNRRLNAKDGQSIFTPQEYKQATYRAQLVTQGAGSLPYVPLWMSKPWAKPLTLFYRVAYRMTEATSQNVIKPIIVEGNMIPAMKYMTGVTGTGFALYQFYDWVLGEERRNQFKSMPSNMLDFFMKGEGLGIFSNAFDEYGGVVDSYVPVIYRNTKDFINMLVNASGELVRGEPEFAAKEIGDGLGSIIAAYNGWKRVADRVTGDTQKKFKESRRRQTQFLDAFYPKEPLNKDYDDAVTSKSAYYKAIRDSFWIDDSKKRAQMYYAALHYLTHTLMADGLRQGSARKEARIRLKNTMARLRPIPTSWRKKVGRTGQSKYREYYSKLSEEDRKKEDELDSLYLIQRRELYQAINEYKKLYDTEIY